LNKTLFVSADALTLLQHANDIAIEIYGVCNFDQIRFVRGNYASYGQYLARYHRNNLIIEIPLNPSFKVLKIKGNRIEIIDVQRFFGHFVA